MSSATVIEKPAAEGAKATDLTGRSQMVSNVLFTWGGQMVFFVSGFIMPRLIDHKLGQEVLGVWDLSWTLITYFRFVEMGVTASVNRYVARHWGQQDFAGINRVVSSATCALGIAAVLVMISTAVAIFFIPHWFAEQSPADIAITQKSVFWLGMMLAVSTALEFNGVLTGCHR